MLRMSWFARGRKGCQNWKLEKKLEIPIQMVQIEILQTCWNRNCLHSWLITKLNVSSSYSKICLNWIDFHIWQKQMMIKFKAISKLLSSNIKLPMARHVGESRKADHAWPKSVSQSVYVNEWFIIGWSFNKSSRSTCIVQKSKTFVIPGSKNPKANIIQFFKVAIATRVH